MKKYFGGAMGAYCAIAPFVLIALSIAMPIILSARGFDFFTVLFALCGVGGVIIGILMMHKFSLLFYSWGTFDEKSIHIKSLFSKNFEIEYEKCKSIGIGLYVHGVLGSDLGSKERYIFFSYGGFREQFRLNINQWQPNETRIKVKYSKKLYDYLLTVLPKQQAKMLKNDYETYVKPFTKK